MAHDTAFPIPGNFSLFVMVIVVTRFCNTDSCTYCHVHTRDFDVNAFNGFSKDDGTVEKILALAEASGDFELRFFGGEPLMRKDVVMRMVEAIDEKVRSDSRGLESGSTIFETDNTGSIGIPGSSHLLSVPNVGGPNPVSQSPNLPRS